MERRLRAINNPHPRDALFHGTRHTNCTQTAIAADDVLAGGSSHALPGYGQKLHDVVAEYGTELQTPGMHMPPGAPFPWTMGEQQAVFQHWLLHQGNGSRALVFYNTPNGHVFNAVNDNGVVRYFDTQVKSRPQEFTSIPGYYGDRVQGLSWLPTTR